jgi:hypothetical protein
VGFGVFGAVGALEVDADGLDASVGDAAGADSDELVTGELAAADSAAVEDSAEADAAAAPVGASAVLQPARTGATTSRHSAAAALSERAAKERVVSCAGTDNESRSTAAQLMIRVIGCTDFSSGKSRYLQ